MTPGGLVRATAFGLALGALARAAQYSPDATRWTLTLGVPWLALAFAAGALARRHAAATVEGAIVLVVAVMAYYWIATFVEGHYSPLYSTAMVIAWGSLGAAAGAVFGAAGAVWRGGREPWLRAAALALLCGALAGEALLMLGRGLSAAGEAVMHVELAAAVVLAVGLSGSRREAAATVPLTAVATLLALVAETGVRQAMHAGGWGGV